MNDIPEDWVFLETAWRFALLLTGCFEGTSKVFKDSVDELLRHPHPGDAERTQQLFFTIIRRRSLKFPARCELDGTAAKLHKLPEPGRSALALLYLDALSASEVQSVVNLDERLLADAVDKTRVALREQRAVIK
jgi:DNA-directed RNA polymerase specialized sigma24 family protein